MSNKATLCLWYDKDAEEAANFYAATFPDSAVGGIHRAPGDNPSGKEGDVLTVDFTVLGYPCIGLNGGSTFKHSEAFPSRCTPTRRKKPTGCGTRSSATADRKACAAGARTNGAFRGRSPRAR